MKNLLLLVLLLTYVNVSQANNCSGTDTFYTCYDYQSGNSYNVSKFGNQTYINGYNSRTNSSWSSTSYQIGDTIYQNGYSKDGSSWNQTIQRIGNYTYYNGTDSNGNSYSKTCNAYGCY